MPEKESPTIEVENDSELLGRNQALHEFFCHYALPDLRLIVNELDKRIIRDEVQTLFMSSPVRHGCGFEIIANTMNRLQNFKVDKDSFEPMCGAWANCVISTAKMFEHLLAIEFKVHGFGNQVFLSDFIRIYKLFEELIESVFYLLEVFSW